MKKHLFDLRDGNCMENGDRHQKLTARSVNRSSTYTLYFKWTNTFRFEWIDGRTDGHNGQMVFACHLYIWFKPNMDVVFVLMIHIITSQTIKWIHHRTFCNILKASMRTTHIFIHFSMNFCYVSSEVCVFFFVIK